MAYQLCRTLPLFIIKTTSTASYGMLAVVLFVNLYYKGLAPSQSSWMQSAIIMGGLIFSLVIRRQAYQFGSVTTLMMGTLLRIFAGIWYAYSQNMALLVVSGIFGVISALGGESSPFAKIEQQIFQDTLQSFHFEAHRTQEITAQMLKYYSVSGFIFQGIGAGLASYYIDKRVGNLGYSYQSTIGQIVKIFVAIQVLVFLSYFFVEEKERNRHEALLPRGKISLVVVCLLLNGVGGGFVTQPFLSYYYQAKYGLSFLQLGVMLLLLNISNALSRLSSAQLTRTHGVLANLLYGRIPFHFCLMLIAFTSHPMLSLGLLLLSSTPQQSLLQGLSRLQIEENSIKEMAFLFRTFGLVLGLGFNSFYMNQTAQSSEFSMPFLIGGVLKLFSDGLLVLFLKGKEHAVEERTKHREINQSAQFDDAE